MSRMFGVFGMLAGFERRIVGRSGIPLRLNALGGSGRSKVVCAARLHDENSWPAFGRRRRLRENVRPAGEKPVTGTLLRLSDVERKDRMRPCVTAPHVVDRVDASYRWLIEKVCGATFLLGKYGHAGSFVLRSPIGRPEDPRTWTTARWITR